MQYDVCLYIILCNRNLEWEYIITVHYFESTLHPQCKMSTEQKLNIKHEPSSYHLLLPHIQINIYNVPFNRVNTLKVSNFFLQFWLCLFLFTKALLYSSNAFTSSNFVHVQTTYAGSQTMQSAYQTQKGWDNARSEPKPGQSREFKKKRKKRWNRHIVGRRKKNPRQQKQRQHKARGGMSLDWQWSRVNTTLEYKVDKCSLTPLVLRAGREEMHMYKLLPVCVELAPFGFSSTQPSCCCCLRTWGHINKHHAHKMMPNQKRQERKMLFFNSRIDFLENLHPWSSKNCDLTIKSLCLSPQTSKTATETTSGKEE